MVNWKELIDAFHAFNVNGLSNLAYIMMSNWWFVLIALAAITAIIIGLKEAMEYSTTADETIVL